MFCRNCGNQMVENAAVCVKCGVAAGTGLSFCPNCGGETNPNQEVCLKCGVSLKKAANAQVSSKSKLTAGLLGLFLGWCGIHNFYLGKTGRAILQLVLYFVTCGAAGLWGFIEGILILCGKGTDANGAPLAD